MPPVNIYRCGDKVSFGSTTTPVVGTVTSVCLSGHSYECVSYRVVWFDGSTFHGNWLNSEVVEAVDETAPRATVAMEVKA